MGATDGFFNEMKPEFLSIHAINPWAVHNSGARSSMMNGHITQRIVPINPTPMRFQTGMLQAFGPHTFSVKMPCNAKIIKILHRYPKGVDKDSLDHNPEILVFYEDQEKNRIDFISITEYQSFHQTFGFRNVMKDSLNKIYPGAEVEKGLILADSPGAGPHNNYMFGVELESAFVSLPATAEDGYIISRSGVKKLMHNTYEVRHVNVGSSKFALNIFGTIHNYKAMPDIGDPIRDDGLLMVLRPYDSDLSPVEMSIYDTMEPNFHFDEPVYTKAGKGRIIDIRVVSNNSQNKKLPELMGQQLNRYRKAKLRFHKEILEFDRRLRDEQRKKYGVGKLRVSAKYNQLVEESLALTNYFSPNDKNRQPLNLSYRKEPVDEYRIEFVIEYETIPDIGYKLSGIAGDKGVIVKIEEDENMPVDAAGNRAELLSDPVATLNRMNLSRLYEQYHGGAARDISVRIREMLSTNKQCTMEHLEMLDRNVVENAYNYLLSYYDIISERQFEFFKDLPYELKLEHLYDVARDGIYGYIPIDTNKDPVKVIKDIERNFKPVYDRISFVGQNGERKMSADKIRIGPMYIMLLDKTAQEWSATATARPQHFGILTPLTKSEKYSRPYRNNPTRTIGETEGCLYACYGGYRLVAELFDRSNNPAVQKNITYTLLTVDRPGGIEQLVDRNHFPYGELKSLGNIKHIFSCAGFRMTFVPEDQNFYKKVS